MHTRLLPRATVIAVVAILGLAAPTMVNAAAHAPAPEVGAVLQGKVPQCSGGVGSVALGLPGFITGPSGTVITGPDMMPRGDTYIDGGLAYVFTPIDSPDNCPGPPSDVKILSPVVSSSCGSMELLTFEITDQSGFNVKDGTKVSLSANRGSLPESVATKDGIAYATYTTPSDTPGRAEIIVRAGAVFSIKNIDITCS